MAVREANQLVGTWRLVSASASTATGHTDEAPSGPQPRGLLIYTADGTMNSLWQRGRSGCVKDDGGGALR